MRRDGPAGVSNNAESDLVGDFPARKLAADIEHRFGAGRPAVGLIGVTTLLDYDVHMVGHAPLVELHQIGDVGGG